MARRPSVRLALAAPYNLCGVWLAHRSGRMMVGFSSTLPVGADIEVDTGQRPLDVASLAVDQFAASEAAFLANLAPSVSRHAFLRLWVTKEVVLRLTGRGIADGLCRPDLLLGLMAGLGLSSRTMVALT